MSNTYIDIKARSDRSWFSNRKHHNNRHTNLSTSDFKNDDCINIIKIVNDDVGKKIVPNVFDGKVKKKRGDISRVLSATNSKIKKYEEDIKDLFSKASEPDITEKEFYKLQKKIDVKIRTLDKAKAKSEALTLERDSISADFSQSNKNKNRKNFVELTLSVTKTPEHLRQDQDYGKDLLNATIQFYELLGLNMDVHSYSLHQDQSSPHIHILGSYENKETSLNLDLFNRFGKKFNYHTIQSGFNKFIREHRVLKKYDHIKDLANLERGKKYENLKNYKNFTKEVGKLENKAEIIYEKISEIGLAFGIKQAPNEDILDFTDKITSKLKEVQKQAKNNDKLAKKQNEQLSKFKSELKILNSVRSMKKSEEKKIDDILNRLGKAFGGISKSQAVEELSSNSENIIAKAGLIKLESKNEDLQKQIQYYKKSELVDVEQLISKISVLEKNSSDLETKNKDLSSDLAKKDQIIKKNSYDLANKDKIINNEKQKRRNYLYENNARFRRSVNYLEERKVKLEEQSNRSHRHR